MNSTEGLLTAPNPDGFQTDQFSSYESVTLIQNPVGDEDERIVSTKTVGGLTWHIKYKLVSTTTAVGLDSINIHLGKTVNPNLSTSTIGRRYFTDLRFEKLTDYTPSTLGAYLNYLEMDT